jgi:hypothetical protein
MLPHQKPGDQPMSKEINYGIDAPHVIRNLLIASAVVLVAIGITPPALHIGSAKL